MSDKFQNKYRIPSARLQNWDYGSNAMYFVTICTKNREWYFGEIAETPNGNEMQLSEIGQNANNYWIEIPIHFPFVVLGNHIVMPNHVHGIIVIDKMNGMDGDGNPIICRDATICRDAINRVSTNCDDTTQITMDEIKKPGGFAGNKNPMLSENLSRIIRWYKGRVSFESHNINQDFSWQSRFHDHIIRDAMEFERISNYIVNNPAKWADDKFYSC